jgi:hypothetical protein
VMPSEKASSPSLLLSPSNQRPDATMLQGPTQATLSMR